MTQTMPPRSTPAPEPHQPVTHDRPRPRRLVAPARRSDGPPRWRIGPSVLGLLAGWVALFSWRMLVAEPADFLAPALVIGLLVVLAGAGLRTLLVEPYAVAAAQLVTALLAVNVAVADDSSWLHLIPTRASVREAAFAVYNGAATLGHYTSPVSENPAHTRAFLLVCALAALLSIELIITWLRILPLVALPLLITLSVPVSILVDALSAPIFVITALLFLRLLATDQLDRLRNWGPGGSAPPRSVAVVLWTISAVAVVGALVVSPLVPVTNLLERGVGPGPGSGGSGTYQLTAVNPMVRLRRDLVEQTHTPMVYAETDARNTGYLRTTVLDRFTSRAWQTSERLLPPDNDADGDFPAPPGLGPNVGGAEEDWQLQLAPAYTTTWLPLPYPLREVDVEGNWRYDSRTLDVALVGGRATRELAYGATSFTPRVTAEVLQSTVGAPARVRVPNTVLPEDLPPVIAQRAREVTRGADTNYEKAVALQNWFRQDGGFEYSLEQRSGSGLQLLADFVTDDRVGYCEQFAAAMAAMARTLDIPARVVVGFLDGEEQLDGRILYTSDDRHAWPELYFSGVGWVRFEPTPGQRAGATPSWTRQSLDDPEASAPTPEAVATPSTDPNAAEDDADGGSGTGVDVPWIALAVLTLIALAGLLPALLRRLQRQRRLSGDDLHELSEGAWDELRATALDLGLDWPERRSPREQAKVVIHQVRTGPEEVRALKGLLTQVERSRYGPDGDVPADAETRARTVETLARWRNVLRSSVEQGRAWRGRLWPGSLIRGRRR